MYIKIERKDKTECHHAKSYYKNECGEGLDFNVILIDGSANSYRIESGDDLKVYIMNDDGKTIDAL